MILDEKIELAVIIPYFKKKYFNQALASFADQSDRRFRIYIGDDCSPEKIVDIVESYADKLDIKYFRFEQNVGGLSLVKQWTRCVNLCNEKWIWLFSDDDIAGRDCVKLFYQSMVQNSYSVYRFNTILVGQNSEVLKISPPLPQRESAIEFLYHRMNGNRHSCGVNHIFSRDVFVKTNGFVDFPLAWYSDDASWMVFAGVKGFFTLDGDNIYWRISDSQISSKKHKHLGYLKAQALVMYLEWMRFYFKGIIINSIGLDIQFIMKNSRKWFMENLIYIGTSFSVKQTVNLSKKLSKANESSFRSNLFIFIEVRIRLFLKRLIGRS